jgi:hypothetical protein
MLKPPKCSTVTNLGQLQLRLSYGVSGDIAYMTAIACVSLSTEALLIDPLCCSLPKLHKTAAKEGIALSQHQRRPKDSPASPLYPSEVLEREALEISDRRQHQAQFNIVPCLRLLGCLPTRYRRCGVGRLGIAPSARVLFDTSSSFCLAAIKA